MKEQKNSHTNLLSNICQYRALSLPQVNVKEILNSFFPVKDDDEYYTLCLLFFL